MWHQHFKAFADSPETAKCRTRLFIWAKLCACISGRVHFTLREVLLLHNVAGVRQDKSTAALCGCVSDSDSLTLSSVLIHANESLLTCHILLAKDNPLIVSSIFPHPSLHLCICAPAFYVHWISFCICSLSSACLFVWISIFYPFRYSFTPFQAIFSAFSTSTPLLPMANQDLCIQRILMYTCEYNHVFCLLPNSIAIIIFI